MRSRAARQTGFSLIELMMTAFIFGVGLLGLAALQVATLRNNTGSRNRFTATSLAEGCMSAIQAEGSTSWNYAAGIMGTTASPTYPTALKKYTGAGMAGSFGSFDVNGLPLATGDPNTVFTVAWTRLGAVASGPGTQTPITNMNLREFVVTVSWQDQATNAAGVAVPQSTMSLSRLIRY